MMAWYVSGKVSASTAPIIAIMRPEMAQQRGPLFVILSPAKKGNTFFDIVHKIGKKKLQAIAAKFRQKQNKTKLDKPSTVLGQMAAATRAAQELRLLITNSALQSGGRF